MRRLTLLGVALWVVVAAATGVRPAQATGALIGVDADAATSGRQPNGVVLVSSAEIAVDIDIENANALGAFEVQALYDPAYLVFLRWSVGPFLGSTGRAVSCQQNIAQTTVDVGCGTVGAESPASGDGVLTRLYFRPKVQGTTCLLLLKDAASDVLGNQESATGADGCVTIVSGAGDSDGDGCSDANELGPSHRLGGQRDPSDPWDFFDVPTPALRPDNTSGRRDGAVTIGDVLAVLNYYGTRAGGATNPLGVRYDSDLNQNGVPDGREYDRSIVVGALEPWRSGPPNGSVSLGDALVALAQVGDKCTT